MRDSLARESMSLQRLLGFIIWNTFCFFSPFPGIVALQIIHRLKIQLIKFQKERRSLLATGLHIIAGALE